MINKWEKNKWIFEPDGSLLDVYVKETTLVDWLTLIDFLNANYKVKYGPTSENETGDVIDKDYITKYLLDKTGELETKMVSVFSDDLIFNSHFFLENEIEFDIDPGEFKGQKDFETVIAFMSAISQQLDKEVILTPENSPELPLITIGYNSGKIKISTQEELKQLHKDSITWTARVKGFFISGLLRLLQKLKQSRFKEWLTDYVIGLMGGNKPHTANKKSNK